VLNDNFLMSDVAQRPRSLRSAKEENDRIKAVGSVPTGNSFDA
jgi:hypothetical protein